MMYTVQAIQLHSEAIYVKFYFLPFNYMQHPSPLTFLRLVLTDLILGFLTPATLNTADSFLPFPGPFCLFLPMDIFCVWKTKLSA